MKLHPPLTAITIYGKLFVEGYKTEAPICSGKPECIRCLNSRCKYLLWKEQPKARYPVHEGDVVDFNILLSNIFRSTKKDIYAYSDYTKQLEEGIDISHLSDRIILVSPDPKSATQFESFIKLKPIQEEESPIRELDLYTLERIKFMFEIHSDNSARCNGYNSLVRTINDIKSKQP